MFYSWDKKTMGAKSWISYIQTITDLEISAIGKFTIKEVHYTMPKTPGTRATDFPSLPHITIENVSGQKIHWYIWKKKLDADKRIEEMMGSKIKTPSTNLGEKELVDKVMADINQQGWF
jgi:hypothetical protein